VSAKLRVPALADDVEPASWPLLPALAALTLCWAVLGWPWLSGRVAIPWDAKAQFLPHAQFLAQSLWRGESPFWSPYVFGGHPMIADPQSLIFSPPFLLLALVNPSPGSHAFDVTVLVMILVSASALLIWARDRGWHWSGALLAAVCFGFGAAMAWRIQHTGQVLSLCYLPMTLLLLDRALERSSVMYGVATGLVAASLLLGRDQAALLCGYLLAAYVVWRVAGDGRARSSSAPLAAAMLTGLAVIAVPVLATAVVAAGSNRPSIDYIGAGRGSLHPALLLTAFAPDVFGSSGRMEDYWGPPSFAWSTTGLYIAQNMGQLYFGAIPALLLLIGLFSRSLRRREVRFFAVALAITLLYALGWYTPLFGVAHAWLPGVDYYRRPADAVFLVGFLSALLAGYTLHALMTAPVVRLSRATLGSVAGIVATALACALLLALHFGRVQQALAPLAISAVLVSAGALVLALALRLRHIRPIAATAVIMIFTVANLAVSNGPGSATALPPETYDVLEPDTKNETIRLIEQKVAAGRSDTRRDRVELAGLGFHWANASLPHRLENTLGYNPLRLGLYARAVGAGDHVVGPADRKFTPAFPSYRSVLADLLGLRFIVAGAPVETIDTSLKPGDLTLIAKTADGYIYENPRALPRVLFATSSARADFDAIVATGQWPSVDFAQTVLLESASDSGVLLRPGQVRIESFTNTEVVVAADSPDGGWVVLNDLWHPWWIAEIDGAEVPLLRANLLFRAVAVGPGPHRVRFALQPISGALRELGGTFAR